MVDLFICLCSERLEHCERQKNATLGAAVGIWENEIPQLLEVNAALQATHILSGDYNLKIARQDYFISKQDQVSCLNDDYGGDDDDDHHHHHHHHQFIITIMIIIQS